MDTTHELHPPTQRPNTLTEKISAQSWKGGLQNTFLYNIPFSSRNNPDTAHRHAAMIAHLNTTHQLEHIHLLEVGACHGILAQHLLCVLSEEFPELYAKIVLTISDYDEQNLAFLAQDSRLDKYRDKLRLMSLDALDHTYQEGQRWDYIYHAYLYNAFPCQHYALEKGRVYELLVGTSIPETLCVIDPNTDETLTASDLQQLYRQDPDSVCRRYGRQLSPFLKEHYSKQELSAQQEADLIACFPKQGDDQAATQEVNISPAAASFLRQLTRYLSDSGAYCFSDVTLSSNPNLVSKTTQTYTSHVHYYPILPAYLQQQCPSDFQMTYVQHHNQELSDFMICKRNEFPDYAKHFNKVFANAGLDDLQAFQETLSQNNPKTPNTPAELKATINAVPPRFRQDYAFFQTLINFCFHKGWFAETKTHAQAMIATYGLLALNAHQVLASMALLEKDTQALTQYEPTLQRLSQLFPEDLALSDLLGAVYMSLKRYTDAYNAYLNAIPILVVDRLAPDLEQMNGIHEKIEILRAIETRDANPGLRIEN